jgi:predicted transcriptional regulator
VFLADAKNCGNEFRRGGAVFALADPSTIRLLRALSLDGPASVRELTIRLSLRHSVVCQTICQVLAIGVVRSCSDSAGRYEIVPAAVTAAVAEQRESLLGATA